MGRQKLRVEVKAEEVIAEVARLLRMIPYHCGTCTHLDNSADSVSFNIGEGVACYKPRKKASKYDIARSEAKEVQRALRSLVLKGKLKEDDTLKADDLADAVIGMLTVMIKNLEDRS